MEYKIITLLLLVLTQLGNSQVSAQFSIADQGSVASIVYDQNSSELDSIVAHLLVQDIEAVTGQRPKIYQDISNVRGSAIIIGDISSELINSHIDTTDLSGEWETYARVFKEDFTGGIDQAMFIAGSDPRGMAYGVFELSEEIGVSPWYWWADVPVQTKSSLSVSNQDTISASPSVKYRGIFLNDEGWGLEPWASKTFEPTVGNMGPKTYAKIFELLLRLKANMVWPAMHPNTTPFFQVPGNPETARKWQIVVGTSHAEPMLRNNVGEWDHEKRGDFNYQTNDTSVYRYWEQRVRESRELNAIYTTGMRGIHDSGIVGAGSTKEKVRLLEKVISDQRELLSRYIHDDVSEVLQSFTPYKEVLDIYENGLDLPEDVTIIWPDDNHGYIRRFSNEDEQQRTGGSGVYYHLSYLGAPHPYIWLSPTTPALVWREMTRAWQQNMDQIWIVNVGDLKRREWETEFFMDLAWDIESWTPDNLQDFFETVATRDLSKQHGKEISGIMWEYYRFATERKPEFMGFNESQWAGWPPVRNPLYSLWNYGDEAEQRIRSYRNLQARAKKVSNELPGKTSDAFFQLVTYPISAAAAMNEKWLYAYKSREYAKQGRASANRMSDSAFVAFDRIQQLSHYYNKEVAGGKWEHMVDYKPGYKMGSPVFFEPVTTRIKTERVHGVGVSIEGQKLPLKPINGTLPYIKTRESNITINASEATISGELSTGKDSAGTFLRGPEESAQHRNSNLNWDIIPNVVESSSKAVFEFYVEDDPGGIHTLYLSVDQLAQDDDPWWVTLNDHKSVKVNGPAGRTLQLKVGDVVLKPGRNKLTIHPPGNGAKLYGVEFLQESRQLSAEVTEENLLPVFNRYSQKRHFIDIFNRGEESVEWLAVTSAPWIELSEDQGSLSDETERIWVTVNYDQAPADRDIKGHIEIKSEEQSYRVAVSAFNQTLNAPSDAYIETNGVISMPASQYHEKENGKVASWHAVTGLGRSGLAMLPEPITGWHIDDLSQVPQNSPVLEYEVVVVEGGQANVIIEAVPAFPLEVGQTLQCAISIDDQEPQWVTFDMGKPGIGPWEENVLEGRMFGTGQLNLDPGTYRFRLWGTTPSVNIDRITIDFGGLKPSYTGPNHTKINKERF